MLPHPNEEHEENPPFCYYDAASESKQALSISPDIEALDVALSFYQQTDNRAPAFHRSFGNESQETVVMPRKGDGRARDTTAARQSEAAQRNVLDDSDVVEVVKVRRSLGYEEEVGGYGLKKSRSFRARASKAFKSIRNLNVTKGNRRSAHAGKDSENAAPILQESISSRPSTPNLPRRKSMQLTQLFSSTRNTRSASFDKPPSPQSPTSPTPSEWSTISRPSVTLGDCTNVQEPPTLSSKRSFRRRMSVLDLHRFFTPASQSAEKSIPSPTSPTSSISPISPSEESVPSSSSSRLAKHESLFFPRSSSSSSNFLQNLNGAFSAPSASASSPTTLPSPSTSEALGTDDDGDVVMGDDSFEMRLDSLHFDSLHFDPEEFDC
ncbi:hypothetical protein NM688_g3606 [Phlebia brevispora]|uniref:Uncharacterized protein n=1 Tax=Phlebia brevispora TaxID=194682 RepID=A0ACC1T5H1_9APHY|nr:hypothetical protein NM688_g3606 [Phlebia brevispora]